MTEFKTLPEGEKPANPENYLLIEKVEQPVSGEPGYRVIGDAYNQGNPPTDIEQTYHVLEHARERALYLAKIWDLSVVYLTEEVTREWTWEKSA